MKKITISIFLLIFSASVSAQFGRMGKMNSEHRAAALERIENYKKLRMVEVLKLNEEQSVKLLARYNKHRELTKGLEKERMAIVDKIENLLSANTSDSDFNKNLNDLIDADKRLFELRAKYFSELKEIFSSKQIAEYIVFERNFMSDIRDIARDIQQQRKEK